MWTPDAGSLGADTRALTHIQCRNWLDQRVWCWEMVFDFCLAANIPLDYILWQTAVWFRILAPISQRFICADCERRQIDADRRRRQPAFQYVSDSESCCNDGVFDLQSIFYVRLRWVWWHAHESIVLGTLPMMREHPETAIPVDGDDAASEWAS